jgi:Protein of unknown function (DUF3305)
MPQKSISMPLGVVIRKTPGVTRWAGWTWRAVAVLPGAGPESWRELRREGETAEYHAATVELELWRTEAEAYLTELSTRVPSVYVVLRQAAPGAAQDVEVLLATVSPYEAQDYADTGEEIVDQVAMPEGLVAWVDQFVRRHHAEEVFVKRRRGKSRVDLVEDGVGDARVSQLSDVYRAPVRKKPQALH